MPSFNYLHREVAPFAALLGLAVGACGQKQAPQTPVIHTNQAGFAQRMQMSAPAVESPPHSLDSKPDVNKKAVRTEKLDPVTDHTAPTIIAPQDTGISNLRDERRARFRKNEEARMTQAAAE